MNDRPDHDPVSELVAAVMELRERMTAMEQTVNRTSHVAGRPFRTQTAGEAEVSCWDCQRWFKLSDLIDVDPSAGVTSAMVADATKAHHCRGRQP